MDETFKIHDLCRGYHAMGDDIMQKQLEKWRKEQTSKVKIEVMVVGRDNSLEKPIMSDREPLP